MVKNLPAMQETWVQFLGLEDPLGKGMVTDSSILAWRTPWAEKPGGLQSMGLQRVRQDWTTNTYTHTHTHTHTHRYLKLRNLSFFLHMGRYKILGSLKSFLSNASRLSGASILRFSPPSLPSQSPPPCPTSCSSQLLNAERGSGWWLPDGRYCFSWAPLGTGIHIWRAVAVTSLFFDMAGNTSFLTSQSFIKDSWEPQASTEAPSPQSYPAEISQLGRPSGHWTSLCIC